MNFKTSINQIVSFVLLDINVKFNPRHQEDEYRSVLMLVYQVDQD